MPNLKLKDNIDLNSELNGWKETEESFELDGPFDEFISVNKSTRKISQYGYNGLVSDWINQGMVEAI